VWLRAAVLFVHIAAATFWVGEMLFLAAVVGPYSRTLPPNQRAALFTALGRRSRPWAWAAVAVLVGTGLGNVALLGIPLGQLVHPAFYRTPFGETLGAKLVVVALLLATSFAHDVLVANTSARLRQELQKRPQDPLLRAAEERARRLAGWLGRMGLILALAVVFLAARLGSLT
jgi:uncharacterized membrane protein